MGANVIFDLSNNKIYDFCYCRLLLDSGLAAEWDVEYDR